jgi:lysophospholipase L1-like esterase
MNINTQAKRTLCFGDSNTWGFKPDRSGRFAADARWTGVAQRLLGNDYEILEEGLSRRTTDIDYQALQGLNGKAYLDPCLETHSPLDVLVILLGTNDLKVEFNRSTADIAQAIRGLVRLVDEKPKINPRIVLMSPPLLEKRATDFYTGQYDAESVAKSHALAGSIQSVASDTGCIFIDASKLAEAGEDGVHMTQASHEKLGGVVVEQLRRVS